MRILFLQPPKRDYVDKDFLIKPPLKIDRDYFERETPSGLALVANVVRSAGYEVRVVDAEIEKMPLNYISKYIQQFDPDVLAIDTQAVNFKCNYNLDIYQDLSFKVKRIKPDIKIISGGILPSIEPVNFMLRYPDIDFLIQGETEMSILELLSTLKRNKNISKIPGIYYRKDREIVYTFHQNLVENLDNLPLPAFDLLKLNYYWSAGIIAGRGCPYGCAFCINPIDPIKKWRARTAKNLFQEIEVVVNKYNFSKVNFIDSIFTFDKKRIEELCRMILNSRLDFRWRCQSRVDHVDYRLLLKMKKAGCEEINYGIESGSQVILDSIKKDVTLEQIRTAIKQTSKVGIKVNLYLMVGHYLDTEKTIRKTVNFVKSLNFDRLTILLATPFKETEYYKILKREGLINNSNNTDKSFFSFYYGINRHRGKYLTGEQRIKLYRWAEKELSSFKKNKVNVY